MSKLSARKILIDPMSFFFHSGSPLGKYPAFAKVSDESIAVLGTGVADKTIMAL